MGKLDEFKAISARGIGVTDRAFGASCGKGPMALHSCNGLGEIMAWVACKVFANAKGMNHLYDDFVRDY